MASSGSFNTNAYSSGDWERYLRFEWSVQSQSVANNTTTISYTLKGAGGATNNWHQSGNFKLVIDGSTVYSSATRINLMNGTIVKSGTFTMSHDSAGKRSFSASAEAGINLYAVNCRGSGSWSLPDIPRAATINSADNFNDTGNPKITYSNPAGNSVSSLQACIANPSGSVIYAAYRDISKTGNSYTFNLTAAERNALLAACPNSKTLAVKFYVTTVIGGTTYYSTLDRTMTVVDANPTFSSAYLDSNSATTAVTGNNQQIVRSQSSLQINVTNLSAKKSATISSVKCLLNGTTYTGSISGSSCTFNIGSVNSASNLTATITTTDSRGFAVSQNLNITMLDWVQPSAITTMQRENNFYSNTSIKVDGSISSVDNKNTMTLKLRYKKTTDSTWSTYVTMTDNVAQTFNLDNSYQWDVQVQVIDKFATTTYNLVLPRGLPIIYFDRIKSSTGFNCFPQENNAVEVNGINVLRSVMTRYLTADLSNLTADSYVKINLTGTNSFGSKLTATSDGGIKIGAGVSKILVSGRMLTSCSVVGSQYIRICKNDASSSSNMLAWVSHTNTTTSAAFETLNATPALVDVQENDVIYLYYYVPASSGTIYGNNYGNQTSLTVETVG